MKARIHISVLTTTLKDNLKFSKIKLWKNNFNLNKTSKFISDSSYFLLFLAWHILQRVPPQKKKVKFLEYKVINTISCYFHYIFYKFDVNE